MRATHIITLLCLAAFIPSTAFAQGRSPWLSDLQTAQKIAKEQHKLILIHFWGDNCPPCKKMDQQVFSRPEVMQAISSNYVPVKINVNSSPELRKRFNVNSWPTDIVFSNAGKEIGRSSGFLEARKYTSSLSQLAANYHVRPQATTNLVSQNRPGYGQASYQPAAPQQAQTNQYNPAGRPGAPANRQGYQAGPQGYAGNPQSPPNLQKASRYGQTGGQVNSNRPTTGGYATQQTAPNQYGPSQQQQYGQSQPQQKPQSNYQYGQRAADNLAGSNSRTAQPQVQQGYGQQRSTQQGSGQGGYGQNSPRAEINNPYANESRPAYGNQNPIAERTPAQAQPEQSAHYPTEQRYSSNSSQPQTNNYAHPANNKPSQYGPSSQNGSSNRSEPVVETSRYSAPDTSYQPQEQVTSHVAPEPTHPAANYQKMGLDGYCPVTLVELKQWKKGDPRWGATSRGRTYRFTSQLEQQKFLADPDSYCPMLSGYDAVKFTEQGLLVEGKREHGVFLGNQIYLFADNESLQRFESSAQHYANTAEQAMRHSGAGVNTRR